MAKKDEELNEVIKIAVIGAIAYFGVVRPLMQKLGITDDEADEVVNNQANVPDSENPFSLQWGYFDQNLGKNIAEPTVQGIYDQAGTNFLGIPQGGTLTYYWVPLADSIYHAMGFLWIGENTVVSAFSQMKSKADVWAMAVYFQAKYGVDLWNWIKKGQSFTPWDNGISKQALADIIAHVNQLPLGI
jgi:hypothetical protein